MRPWTERVYGIPPEQVIGSSIKTKFELRDGKPVLVRLPELNFIDDKDGKPVGIHQHIGRRPIAAFGNSDGDLQMLQWTAARQRPAVLPLRPPRRCRARMGLRPRRLATSARSTRASTKPRAKGWTVVSMKDDWKTVFPAAPSGVTAIDILLEPDATMLGHAADNNARLLKVHPAGFSLDEAHTPHITMLQCFARTAELDSFMPPPAKFSPTPMSPP